MNCFFCARPNQKWYRVGVKFVLSQEKIGKAEICEQHHYELQHDDFYLIDPPSSHAKPKIDPKKNFYERQPGEDDA